MEQRAHRGTGSRFSSPACGAAVRPAPGTRRPGSISSATRATACMTVVWSRLPNLRPISGQRAAGELLGEIHRDLPRPGHGAGAAGRGHVGQADAPCSATLRLDLLDRDPAVMRLEHVLQHFLRALERDRAADQVGMREEAVEAALELADVAGDLVRQEFQHLGRDRHAAASPPWTRGWRAAARRSSRAGRRPCPSRGACAGGPRCRRGRRATCRPRR